MFDPRIVEVDLEVNGTMKTYSGISIAVSGVKYANALQNECTVNLTNLDKQTADYILTETSPFTLNKTPKTITVRAGRQSYGTKKIYVGNVVSANISQPPDITVSIKCLTGNFQNGNILSRGQPSPISLFQVSKQLAQDLNTALTFQAADKNLANYIYSGAALKQVDALNMIGGVNVFVDDTTLVVKNNTVPLNNVLTLVSQENGMVGIPELTEIGVKVTFMLDTSTTLGGGLQVISKLNPAINGTYVIYKLGFDVANRNKPFYWIAEAARQKS